VISVSHASTKTLAAQIERLMTLSPSARSFGSSGRAMALRKRLHEDPRIEEYCMSLSDWGLSLDRLLLGHPRHLLPSHVDVSVSSRPWRAARSRISNAARRRQ
jgi:hypothetical protein